MYLLAILLPPLAVLICGKPIQCFVNLLLCCFLVVPGIIHALLIVNNRAANQRNDKLIRALKTSRA